MTVPPEPGTPEKARTAVGGITIRVPGLKVPSGTLYNDILALGTAVVAILKAFGVI